MRLPLTKQTNSLRAHLPEHLPLLILVALLALLPFVLALLDGQSLSGLVANEPGQAKFIQGLLIEVFILAIVAGVFGFTGLAGTAGWIAQLLFVVFLVALVVSVIANAVRGKDSTKLI